MKIGFDFTNLAVGGAQAVQTDLLFGLKKRGHSVYYTVRNSNYSSFFNEKLSSIQKLTPTELNNICDVVQVDGYQKRYDYTIPIIETIHSPYGWSIAKNHTNISGTISISKYIQKEVVTRESTVIYNGVDFNLFPKQEKPPKKFTIGFLGRIHKVKNPLLFLDICKRLPFEHNILIIGDHSTAPDLQKQIKARLGKNDKLTGYVSRDKVYQYLHQCSCLLVTSKYEGLGLMSIEAQACGIPTIVNNCGGLPETVGNSQFIANYNDIDEFIQKINWLYQENKRIKDIKKEFDLNYMVSKYEEVYQKYGL